MSNPFNTISIIGLGYIGLPTAAVFASHKVKVIGVDVNQNTVDTINRGEIHIVEPGLDMAVKTAVADGYLRATTKPEQADAFLIAVPTPFKEGPNGHNHPDTDFIEAAARSIALPLKKGDMVILESTSPVGTTEQLAKWLEEIRPDLTFPQTHGENSDIRMAYCPERVMPGNVLRELVENDRVIGGMSARCSEMAASLYKTIVRGSCFLSDSRTAEMCKLVENSYRDINIAFANELSIISDELGINVWNLISLANRHPRVNILNPGPGVGGHCIAVDPWFIVAGSPKNARIIKTARTVNDEKPTWVVRKIEEKIADMVKENPKLRNNMTVEIYGITYKPNIDDIRESPAIEIVNKLRSVFDGTINVIDGNVKNLPSKIKNVKLINMNPRSRSDLKIMLVPHEEFKKLDLSDRKWLDFTGVCSNDPTKNK
jgi:UDP-N-acetyl-D-mannosaminuronic acid dehydrogenase